jgi:hypothetical protein
MRAIDTARAIVRAGTSQRKCLSCLPECSAERGRRDTGGMQGRKCTSHTCSHDSRAQILLNYKICNHHGHSGGARATKGREFTRNNPRTGGRLVTTGCRREPGGQGQKKNPKTRGWPRAPPLTVTVPRARDVRKLTNQGCILRALC